MAWGHSLTAESVQDNAIGASPFPFIASEHIPVMKPLPSIPTIDDVPIVDQRERERDEVKTNLQSILKNRLFSESARVAAARELTRILNNEEINELREEVARLRAIIEANAEDELNLPPMLRGRR